VRQIGIRHTKGLNTDHTRWTFTSLAPASVRDDGRRHQRRAGVGIRHAERLNADHTRRTIASRPHALVEWRHRHWTDDINVGGPAVGLFGPSAILGRGIVEKSVRTGEFVAFFVGAHEELRAVRGVRKSTNLAGGTHAFDSWFARFNSNNASSHHLLGSASHHLLGAGRYGATADDHLFRFGVAHHLFGGGVAHNHLFGGAALHVSASDDHLFRAGGFYASHDLSRARSAFSRIVDCLDATFCAVRASFSTVRAPFRSIGASLCAI